MRRASTPSGRPASPAARCTACRSSSRTTSTPATGCAPAPDRWRWPTLPAPADAFVVQRLRAAGAIILGKTNCSEWANFRSSHSTSGWSGRGGQTRNPYVLDRNPCGSSSGTGAAISANFAMVGVGTETDGSVVCPSTANGLVGLKPTVGPGEPLRHHPDLGQPGYRRADDAHRARCRRPSQCDDRHRSGRCRDRDQCPTAAPPTSPPSCRPADWAAHGSA